VEHGVATISIDRVDIKSPIAHGDLLRMEGEVIHIGRSSMVIQVRVALTTASVPARSDGVLHLR
jgi:acyl-CoA hydrolase